MADEVERAVRRMSTEVDAAVMRARRLAAEARERAVAFRRETAGLVAPPADTARPTRRRPVVDEPDDYSQEHIMRRR
jgi:hypothetical protein